MPSSRYYRLMGCSAITFLYYLWSSEARHPEQIHRFQTYPINFKPRILFLYFCYVIGLKHSLRKKKHQCHHSYRKNDYESLEKKHIATTGPMFLALP